MTNESCWRAASLADGVVAASFQDQSQRQRVALVLVDHASPFQPEKSKLAILLMQRIFAPPSGEDV
jgi:hypothetical protein